jgi:hypothetical protein
MFMDRNLGATSATAGDNGTIGLNYQWGRKDPFTGSSLINSNTEITVYDGSGVEFKLINKEQRVIASNNLSNSIANPQVFYKGINNSNAGYDWYTNTGSRSSQNDALWGGSNLVTPGEKTIFDPCPAGWRVPAWSGTQSPWSTFTTSNFTWSNYGRTYSGSYYPATGNRRCTDGTICIIDSYGYYWSASPCSDYAFNLCFYDSKVYPLHNSYRAYGFSVRCVKE